MDEAKIPDSHYHLLHHGQKLGLGGGLVADLLQKFGPVAVQVLLKVLQRYGPAVLGVAPGGSLGAILPGGGTMTGMKIVLAELVNLHKPEIMAWLSDAESKIFDALLAKLTA